MKYQNLAILSEAKGYIYFSILLFLAGALIGYSSPERFEFLLASLQAMAEQLRGRSAPVIIISILFQNASSAFLAVWLGVIFGIVPLLGAIANGILLGAVMAVVGDGGAIVTGILPHGIFELPAVFIAWGLGIWRGIWPLQENRREAYRNRARKAYYAFFTVVLPLLIIAATIEGLAISLLT